MDKYKCTHEATLTQSSMWTTTHTHTTALLCTWAARHSTQTDNGRTWLDTSKHIAAVNSAVILSRPGRVRVSFSGRLRVTLGGQRVWYDSVRGRQSLLCVPVALFFWSQRHAKRPWVERSGQVGTVPRFIVEDSYSLEMLLKTGRLRVTLWTVGDMKKSCWGSQRAERDEETPISLCSHLQCGYHDTGFAAAETDCLIYWGRFSKKVFHWMSLQNLGLIFFFFEVYTIILWKCTAGCKSPCFIDFIEASVCCTYMPLPSSLSDH